MTDAEQLTPAKPDDIAEAIAEALQFAELTATAPSVAP
jgi:hypothetical protein